MTKRNPYQVIAILLEFLQRHKHQNNTSGSKDIVHTMVKVSLTVLLTDLGFIIEEKFENHSSKLTKEVIKW